MWFCHSPEYPRIELRPPAEPCLSAASSEVGGTAGSREEARGALANIADMAELKDRIVAIAGPWPLMPNRDCCSRPRPLRIGHLGLA
jgi:hypothetical protein